MWIGSRIRFTARQPQASPPGYQSPASGDNAPDPGSQDALGAQPHHGSAPPTSSHNNNFLANSTPYISHSSTHQEVVSGHQVSQWWGHCGLHQDEVRECGGLEKKLKVSLINRIRQLTAVPRTSVTRPNVKLNEVKETVDQDARHELEPLLARDPAAFKGNDLTQSVDDSSSSITLIDSIRHVNVTPLSLPNDRSYARCNCASIYVPQDPYFENSYAKSTLVNEDPEELSLYQRPDHQPPPFKPGACQ